MIAELGSFSLVLAIVAALLLIVAAAGPRMRLMCRPLALAFAAFMALAFAALLVLFARIDTSVAVVAAYATPDMPLAYRLSAAWGHHEGSMLLFAAVLAVYTAVLACGGRPTRARGTALAIMGALGAMLALYTHFLSSPFARLNPAPMPAAGFNPILEDPLLVIHPPILYLGLAGLALPFAWTLSMLVTGRGGARLRPSLFMPFAFLTAGIALGAFWSFYELGWGGYWAWDPVENSALIPWLLVAAALHAPSRHRVGPSALLLTVLAFLSVLGGLFMVRAGVIDSIHTFAAAPGRGIALLGIFVGVSLASTALFVLRAPATGPISRSERVPALASMLLAGMAATVALGTLYPIIYSPLTGRAITIGPAY
ncbi:MAG: cytochrome c biogenesis protein CcsA, partial [Pseudomonadota bacterium]|nr:cytochrome c biogenesis protein CcsA [Pseudomonadota bacterium]